jgi:acetolactate synthase-1/2/3 large subunit
MNLQEMQTIASQKIPLRLFVINNRGYASIRNTQRNYFEGRYVGSGPEAGLDLPDFTEISRTFGWESFVIDDAADLAPGIARAVAHNGGPLLVDVRVIENETLAPKSAALFREDGSILSMPLEDMSPLLPRDEFRANMIVPLDPASESVPDHLLPKG